MDEASTRIFWFMVILNVLNLVWDDLMWETKCHNRAFILGPYSLCTIFHWLFAHSTPTLPNFCWLQAISALTAVRLVLLSYQTKWTVL
ncbi:hypothetical protein BKA82DRAFT_17866 [Pisolithus tinctorius]|uniref:Uncharacterized protein n=1 Tax=Pisolithus tinctorius Marx 270 TaxID=870435 RepID=A0A0C3PL64_PISTI|nr:hypothetical protein BKA82DRAFT_17866 [Pisolithus tinctorius]KIO15010.1 hypothetical protein M404DRAFT_17866 [Pisolithus tinctorius Marx 270]